jgi:hypothetical protein
MNYDVLEELAKIREWITIYKNKEALEAINLLIAHLNKDLE